MQDHSNALTPSQKTCPRCERVLPAEGFHRNARRVDGLAGWCRDCLNAAKRQRRGDAPDAVRALDAARRTRNHAPISAAKTRWRRANTDRAADLARVKRWQAANPEQTKASKDRWRAEQFGAFVAPVDRRAVWERDRGLCGICGEPVAYEQMHIDHVIPLERGGTHEPANVQAAHARCNRRKGTKVTGVDAR